MGDEAVNMIISSNGDCDKLFGGPAGHADPSKLKRSWKLLCLKVHPDKCQHPEASKAFQILQSAFETRLEALENPQKAATAKPAAKPAAKPSSAQQQSRSSGSSSQQAKPQQQHQPQSSSSASSTAGSKPKSTQQQQQHYGGGMGFTPPPPPPGPTAQQQAEYQQQQKQYAAGGAGGAFQPPPIPTPGSTTKAAPPQPQPAQQQQQHGVNIDLDDFELPPDVFGSAAAPPQPPAAGSKMPPPPPPPPPPPAPSQSASSSPAVSTTSSAASPASQPDSASSTTKKKSKAARSSGTSNLETLFARHGMSLESDEDDDGTPFGAANSTGAWWAGNGMGKKAASSASSASPKFASPASISSASPKLNPGLGSPAPGAKQMIKLACPSCHAATTHDPSKAVVTCKYCSSKFPAQGAVQAQAGGASKGGERCKCGAAKKGACFICG